MKPVSLTEDFIHADFSAVFYECSNSPIVSFSYDKMAFHADSVLFFFIGDYGANFFHNFRH